MADPQIVSCPGCGKRYSVPAGVAPGQFQCQDCSAVVAYGQAAAPPAGKKPHGAGARTHARAAAAKRRLARDRERDDGDDEGPGHGYRSGPKKQDSSVYLMAMAGVVIFAVAGVMLWKKSVPPAPPPKTTASAPPEKRDLGVGDEPEAAAAPAPAPSRAPAHRTEPEERGEEPKPSGGLKTSFRGGVADKPDAFTPAANPPTGSHYGKSQAALLLMLKDKRSEVWVDAGHLPDTPSDLASRIDADIAKMADVNGGSEFLRAQDRLIKVGRAAIPRVVGLTARLDFTKYTNMPDARDACALGDAIDNVLRGITGYDKINMLQYSPQNGKLSEYMDSLDGWCLWWFTIGYKRETFYKASGPAEEEKL